MIKKIYQIYYPLYFLLTTILFFLPTKTYSQDSQTYCNITPQVRERVLIEIKKNNPQAIASLPRCFKLDRKLILKAVLIDPAQFKNADTILKEDELFVYRLLKINPSILQYASKELRGNSNFMKKATYISRDSLQYASKKLRDNRLFMKEMIDIDSRNYKFASGRLRQVKEFAAMAFEDDGLLLEYAPNKIRSNKKLVRIAFASNKNSIKYASKRLQKDKEFQLSKKEKKQISKDDLQKFLQTNYREKVNLKNLETKISNKAKFFQKNKIIDRNYITKWQKDTNSNNLRLITVDSRNYQAFWKDDLAKYPLLVKKIERFFLEHNLDQNTIDSLSTTYLWRIKDKPLTLAFNLYLLRDNLDEDLGAKFSDITSLTAIVQKRDTKWEMTVIEVIFSSETKMNANYPNGHKKYILWDLYRFNDKDNNPKPIFKIEDKFSEYFQIFNEENGGKYKIIYNFDTNKKN